MLNKQITLSLSLLLPIIGVALYQMVGLRKSDLANYQSLIEEKALTSTQAKTPANQERKEVRKDIWFSQDDISRLHYQIESESSLLTLIPIKNRFEVVEILQGIRCWMQDKLYEEGIEDSPMQQARFIQALEGQYRYSTQEFTANDVSLSLFKLPGHELPEDPAKEEDAFLKGVAKDISFLFGGKTPKFQAGQFQATVVKE